MEKVILLKTQLAEAAAFARSKTPGHSRLAVILLDNFIEIQLASLIQQHFRFDGPFYFSNRKYSHNARLKILRHYDELLKTSVGEGFITAQEQRLLLFCHSVRNNLYHKGTEEELIVKVALLILHDLIMHKQPNWKSASLIMSYTSKTNDPYQKPKNYTHYSRNSKEDWEDFLKRYFIFTDKRQKKPTQLLSDYLLNKLSETKSAIKFLKKEYEIFFPWAKDWTFNDFLYNYSFPITNHEQLERAKDIKDKEEQKNEINKIKEEHRKCWRRKSKNRLGVLQNSAKSLSTLPIEKSVERFFVLKEEILLIHKSFQQAASDLDQAVDLAIDEARGN